MHRIAKFDLEKQYNEYVDPRIVARMNELKEIYSNPAGFMLTARLTTNYRCLKGIYSQRREHRLPEWREFCKWIEELPYAKELIIGGEKE